MAALVTVPLIRPGDRGLNTQQADQILPLSWSTVAVNAVFNEGGALTSRPGYQYLHASSLAEEVVQTHTYIDASGNSLTIFATPTKLYKIVGSTVTDITGTATTPTAGDWKFQDFNGKCVAWQNSHTPIVLDDVSDTWADLTGTAIPSGDECLSAHGRIWVLDGNTLKWSDLLIYNDFSGGSAGSADLAIYWPQADTPVGMAEHNGFLFVFGSKSILVLANPDNPANIAIEDKILNVGLIGRDAKVDTPEDFAFCSRLGVTTLGRVIQEKSLPVGNPTPQVKDKVKTAITAVAPGLVKMAFSQEENAVYLTTGSDFLLFDLSSDEFGARVLEWDFTPNAIHEHDGTMYYGVTNYIAKRSGNKDAIASDGTGGNSYIFDWESTWNDLSGIDEAVASRLKILKNISVRSTGAAGQAFTFKWYLDFEGGAKVRTLTIPASALSEWGTFEWGEDEWAGAPPVSTLKSGMSGSAPVFKVGITSKVSGDEFSIRALSIRLKLGKEVG